MKVVITIDLPDGTDVAFADSIPPGPEIPEEAMVVPAAAPFVPQQIIPPHQNPIALNPKYCPTHTSTPTRHVPAGTIKAGPKAGKPYNCFVSCGEAKGVCSWKSDCVEHPKVVA